MKKFCTAAKSKLYAIARKFAKGEEGATMVEYGLMVALIAVVCIAAVTILGTGLAAKFQAVADAVTGAGS